QLQHPAWWRHGRGRDPLSVPQGAALVGSRALGLGGRLARCGRGPREVPPARLPRPRQVRVMRVIGYVRLSKGSANGHSLDGQRESIQTWAKANGHELVTVVAEVASAKTP